MKSGSNDALLCRLADPESPPVAVAPAALPALIRAASDHGVGPVVLRKLAGQCDRDALADLRHEVEGYTGLTLRLRGIAKDAQAFIEAEGLQATIVKGPVFAGQLYPYPGDRPFTDLDILATADARAAFSRFLLARGFYLHKRETKDRTEENQEEKWVHPDQASLLVEVHGNLVHYSRLRQRASFGYDELGQIDPADPRAPLGLFFTAVVHAALGHKFHQLRFLVDVLEAFRKLDEDDRAALAAIAGRLHLRLETAQCLRLIAGLFNEDDALNRAKQVSPGLLAAISGKLVTAQTVMDAPYKRGSRLRRHAFRWIQHVAPR